MRRLVLRACFVRAAVAAEVRGDRGRVCAHRQDAARRARSRHAVAGAGISDAGAVAREGRERSAFSARERTSSATRARRDSCCPQRSTRCRRCRLVVGPDARGVVRAIRKRRRNRAGGAARTGAFRNHPASRRPDRGDYRTAVRRSSIGASGGRLRVAVRHRAHCGVNRSGCLDSSRSVVLSRQSLPASGARQPSACARSGGNGHGPVRRRRPLRRVARGARAETDCRRRRRPLERARSRVECRGVRLGRTRATSLG